ncbi:MAG: DUF1153 domain-containing protein [Paracoccaceae bacterium]
MYLRRSTTPRMVTLPDGSSLSRADLPDPDTRRWVASRKATVVRAVDHGLLSPEEACEMYGLSEEELESWQKAVSMHGINALKTTSLQNYRLGEGVSPNPEDR